MVRSPVAIDTCWAWWCSWSARRLLWSPAATMLAAAAARLLKACSAAAFSWNFASRPGIPAHDLVKSYMLRLDYTEFLRLILTYNHEYRPQKGIQTHW
jgi:hypothetical protein